jgi:hypothetical protein
MPVQVSEGMNTLAISTKKKTVATKALPVAAEYTPPGNENAVEQEHPHQKYTPADLRPGSLLLLEFSRPGIGSKRKRRKGEPDEEDLALRGLSPEAVKDYKKMLQTIDQMTLKVVNMGYQKMLQHFAHVPWGFFCQDDEIEKAYEALQDVRDCVRFTNGWAREQNSPRRVRIDIYPLAWNHTDLLFRYRVGEEIATNLLELRAAYTSKIMWNYRVRFQKAKNIPKLLIAGEQADIVQAALESTKEQRKIMIAIYGDKCPNEWLDARTGNYKDHVRLDYTAIDRAIKHFLPSWEPPTADPLPF